MIVLKWDLPKVTVEERALQFRMSNCCYQGWKWEKKLHVLHRIFYRRLFKRERIYPRQRTLPSGNSERFLPFNHLKKKLTFMMFTLNREIKNFEITSPEVYKWIRSINFIVQAW